MGLFLRINRWAWPTLVRWLGRFCLIYTYGNFLQKLVRIREIRVTNYGTLFFRNRAQLELIRRISEKVRRRSVLKMAVFACSNGAEVYSIVWILRFVSRKLRIVLNAVDISEKAIAFAKKGVYCSESEELETVGIFSNISEEERRGMFFAENGKKRIRDVLKKGITWRVYDAGDPGIIQVLGVQDIIVANNFMCHMEPKDAEKCLRNLAGLAKEGSYLIVSGIDLNERTKVANDLGWKPVDEMMEELHEGDPTLRNDWPWKYWGLEPINRRRKDWKMRYSSVFIF